MKDLTQLAQEKAKDFCEKHGLREHFIERDLTRAFLSALEQAVKPLQAKLKIQSDALKLAYSEQPKVHCPNCRCDKSGDATLSAPTQIGSALDALCEVEDCTELAEHRCKNHPIGYCEEHHHLHCPTCRRRTVKRI